MMSANDMGWEIWDAAYDGELEKVTRLVEAGAPVNWKNPEDVSIGCLRACWATGVVQAGHRLRRGLVEPAGDSVVLGHAASQFGWMPFDDLNVYRFLPDHHVDMDVKVDVSAPAAAAATADVGRVVGSLLASQSGPLAWSARACGAGGAGGDTASVASGGPMPLWRLYGAGRCGWGRP